MHFHILTLMPEALGAYFSESILGRALKKGIVQISCHALRNYAKDKHRTVDDRPYGGGSGMILRPDVMVKAVRDIKERFDIARVAALSPRGHLLTQKEVGRLKTYRSLLLICGRYEGIDQRALDLVVDEEISVGDYVLTGGELAAGIVVDSVARLIPGVVGNEEGTREESHQDGLLEYPHYTRPELFEDLKVPEVLRSGNHSQIQKWRRQESLRITLKNRPDLLEKATLSEEDETVLQKLTPKGPLRGS